MFRMTAVAAVLLLAGQVAAQEVSARLSRTNFEVGQVVQLQVTVRGDGAKQPELPELPEALEVDPGIQHGSSYSVKFVNGRSTAEKLQTWTFFISAREPGSYNIPAVPVTLNGETQYTEPLSMVVREAQRRPQVSRGQLRLQDAVQVESFVDKQEVYEGEALQLTVALSILDYPGIHPSNTGSNSYIPPDTEGFYTTNPEKDMRSERRGDFNWRVQEFRQLLYPTRSGALTIGPWDWNGVVYGHVARGPSRVNIRPSSEPIEITVKPLPPSPPNFSGAVGQFDVNAQLASDLTLQGVPVKLEVVVSGDGNPSLLRTPPLPGLDWCQVAQGAHEDEENANGRLEKIFEFILTPHRPGNHRVPAIAFVYFDPEAGEYRTIETNPLALAVTPAEDEGPMVTAGGSAAGGADALSASTSRRLKPIVSTPRDLAPVSSDISSTAVATLAPPILFGIFAGWVRRRRNYLENPALLRLRDARSVAERAIHDAPPGMETAKVLGKALSGYVADIYDLDGAGLTSHDLQAILAEEAVSEETRQRYVQVMKACERALYAGAAVGAQEAQALREGALAAIAALDGQREGTR